MADSQAGDRAKGTVKANGQGVGKKVEDEKDDESDDDLAWVVDKVESHETSIKQLLKTTNQLSEDFKALRAEHEALKKERSQDVVKQQKTQGSLDALRFDHEALKTDLLKQKKTPSDASNQQKASSEASNSGASKLNRTLTIGSAEVVSIPNSKGQAAEEDENDEAPARYEGEVKQSLSMSSKKSTSSTAMSKVKRVTSFFARKKPADSTALVRSKTDGFTDPKVEENLPEITIRCSEKTHGEKDFKPMPPSILKKGSSLTKIGDPPDQAAQEDVEDEDSDEDDEAEKKKLQDQIEKQKIMEELRASEELNRSAAVKLQSAYRKKATRQTFVWTLNVIVQLQAAARKLLAQKKLALMKGVNIRIAKGVSGNLTLLGAAKDGTDLDLVKKDDGSGRQRWLLEKGNGPWFYVKIAWGVRHFKYFLSTNRDGSRVDLAAGDDLSGRQRWSLILKKNEGPKGEDWYNIKNFGGVGGRRRFLSTDIGGLMIDLRTRDDGNGRQQWVLPGWVSPDARPHTPPVRWYDHNGHPLTKAQFDEYRRKAGMDPDSDEEAPKIKITVMEEAQYEQVDELQQFLYPPPTRDELGNILTNRQHQRALGDIDKTANAMRADASKNWWEFRTKCQQKLADRPNHLPTCKCGKEKAVGATASAPICKICGFMVAHEVPREDCGWKDLSELAWPLLEGASQSSHSEQRYALRAVAQYLRSKPPPWEWSGPESSPLKCAVLCGRPELAYVLLEAGAPVNDKDEEGISVLHWAVNEGQENMCRMILDMDADTNIVDQLGQTPLFFAPTAKICSMLIDSQADLNIVNQKGQSALDVFYQAGLTEVFDYLTDVAKSKARSETRQRRTVQAPK